MRRVLRQRLRDKRPVHLMSGRAGQAMKNESVCQQSRLPYPWEAFLFAGTSPPLLSIDLFVRYPFSPNPPLKDRHTQIGPIAGTIHPFPTYLIK